MSKTKKNAVAEMAKEGARIAFFGALAALVAWAKTKLSGAPVDSLAVIVLTVVIKLVDKYIHTSDIKLNGVSPF